MKNLLGISIDLYLEDLGRKCESNFYHRIREENREKVNGVLLKYKEMFSEFDDDEDK